MAELNLYQILQVDQNADLALIKRAYRHQARLCHPDHFPNNPKLHRQFKELSEAYAILSNVETREKYDKMLSNTPGNKKIKWRELLTKSSKGINSIFDTIFSSESSFDDTPTQWERKGGNILAEVEIPFKMALFGGVKQIEITSEETCSNCHGKGMQNGKTIKLCLDCEGNG